MATAFAFTKIIGPTVTGPGQKVSVYKVQMPSAWVEAGHAMDLSTDFNFVTEATFSASGAVADEAYKFSVVGTYTAKGIAAAGVTLVGHWGAAGTAGVYPPITANTDLSSIDDMLCTVRGS